MISFRTLPLLNVLNPQKTKNMQIFINDEPIECPEKSTISTLLTRQGISTENIAVALNETVVPKTAWEQTEIPEKSNIIIIKAVQGG